MPAPRLRATRTKPANQRSWYGIRNVAGSIPTIELFGDIGHSIYGDPYWGDEGGAGTFKEFCDALKGLGNVPEIKIEIHSYGGDVIVGKGIHDKLVEHPATKTAVIYGVCASAATYPALACEKILMPANSFFLIHNATGMCWGDADDMQSMVDSLSVCDESIAALYAARTGRSVDEIMAIMDEDTWMTGTEAVEMGLADEIIEPITIDPASRPSPENFAPRILNTMPPAARVWFDSRALSNARRIANRTIIPANAMTEAEIKAAEKKLKDDQAAFEKTKNDAAEEAKKIKADAEAEALKIINAAKNPKVEEPGKPLTKEEINNLIAAGNKEVMDELKNLRETALKNLPGGPVLNNGKKPGEEGDPVEPTTEAELEVALKGCKNINERIKMLNTFKARKTA